jgi:hypothetical protein
MRFDESVKAMQLLSRGALFRTSILFAQVSILFAQVMHQSVAGRLPQTSTPVGLWH